MEDEIYVKRIPIYEGLPGNGLPYVVMTKAEILAIYPSKPFVSFNPDAVSRETIDLSQ